MRIVATIRGTVINVFNGVNKKGDSFTTVQLTMVGKNNRMSMADVKFHVAPDVKVGQVISLPVEVSGEMIWIDAMDTTSMVKA
jgi:hypothetical protein